MAKIELTNWRIRRSDGNQWIDAIVPGTVLRSYIAAGIVADLLYDDNWNDVCRWDAFFNGNFEYCAVLAVPSLSDGQRVNLKFDAVNWKADIYVNGAKLSNSVNPAKTHSIEGAFIRGVFDITEYVTADAQNAIEVIIYANDTPGAVTTQGLAEGPGPNGGLLGADNPTLHASVGWDWIPTIPGRNIGIYGEVSAEVTDAVQIIDPWVETRLGVTEVSRTIAAVNLLNSFAPAELTEGESLTIDLGEIVTLGSAEFTWGTESGGAAADMESRYPAAFRLESSADGISWRNFDAYPGGNVSVMFFGERGASANGGSGAFEGHAISDSVQGGTAFVPLDLTAFGMGNVDMPVFAPNSGRYLRFTVIEARRINGAAVKCKISGVKVYAESPKQAEQSLVREYALDASSAECFLRCDVKNASAKSAEIIVAAELEGIRVGSVSLTIPPNTVAADAEIRFTIPKPRLWWPNGYGEPHIYNLRLTAGGAETDVKFGVRRFDYPIDGDILTIYCNGTRIVCKGGNWGMDDALKADSAETFDAKVRLHALENFTMIRNWVGQTNHSSFYDACDRCGILIWDDFWLANPVDGPDPNDPEMFLENAADKIRKYRGHAALCCYCGRNEGDPPEPLYSALPALTAKLDPTRIYFHNSAAVPVGSGGGYSLAYPGGTLGIKQYFNDVTSPVLRSERGIPNVPEISTLKKFLRLEHLWPIDEVWALHDWTYHMNGPANSYMAALKCYLGGEFDIPIDNIQSQKPDENDPVFAQYKHNIYKMCKEVGDIYTAEQFNRAAQFINYDNHRGLFDALSARRSNGLLMWMSQSSWPSFMWQTYDYSLACNGGFYGVKAGCRPVKAIFDPRTEEIVLSNHTPELYENLTLTVQVFSLYGRMVSEVKTNLPSLMPDSSGIVAGKADFTLSETDINFLRLTISSGNVIISRETYWHNRAEYQNYRELFAIPDPELDLTAISADTLRVRNAGATPAVLLRLKVTDAAGDEILPSFWSDNYITLMPGEENQVSVEYNSAMSASHFTANSSSVPLFSNV
ncbi:MAG: hypothetical protein LBD85_01260 [Oscillospiraceae bacterium]|jgi:hypothetical protein|nr:hypothetical protein [Oscillospiraceae bacterium]